MLFVVLPLLCFVLLWIAFLLYEPRASWRRALLSAAVAWGVIVTLITEVLSLLDALTFTGALVCWLLVLLALTLGVWLLARNRPKSIDILTGRMAFLLAVLRESAPLPRALSRWTAAPLLAAFAGLVVIAGLTGIIALGAAPNNWDSMTYHLARVMYWVQQGSVAPYPTDILRQLYEAPWAEFCSAQFYLLTGTDALSASVQWLSMLGSVIGVSLIAQLLGAPRAGQLFAAIFAATIPMGILQATSTQNDYVVTFWFVCFTYFLFAFRERPESLWNPVGLGASLGLAMLTKATTYVYAAPLLLLFGYWAVRRLRWRVWQVALLAGSVAFDLNIGYYIRNLNAFGTIFGPPSEVSHYPNTQFTLATLVANVIRDLALQLGTSYPHTNAAIDAFIHQLFFWLGLNINDPATSWALWAFNALSLSEDYAGNPLHFVIILGILPVYLISARLRANRPALAFSVALVLSFLVFALYLKWQPWNSRLELVYFVLFAPVCGLALARISPRLALSALALTLVVASTPWVVANKSRPLVGPNSVLTTPRVHQYFANRPVLEPAYLGAASYLNQSHCSTIGLMDNIDDWEYPWWVVIAPSGGPLHIEHINVANDSGKLADAAPYVNYHPCAIILNRSVAPATVEYHGATYRLGWKASPVEIYMPQ